MASELTSMQSIYKCKTFPQVRQVSPVFKKRRNKLNKLVAAKFENEPWVFLLNIIC